MPLRVTVNGKDARITPSEDMQTVEFPEAITSFEVDRNFYVEAAKSEAGRS
jgi:hypothetical protein